MFKNLKSLFIVEEAAKKAPEKKGATSTSKATTTKATSGTPTTATPTPAVTTNASGEVEPKIIEKLLEAIEKNNVEGFDYLEYKKALQALEKLPMDEATKYRSAFATASTMGVTLEKLLETVKFYVGVLDNENDKFSNTFKSQLNDKVAGRQQEITQFQAIIKEKADQISKLTADITKHQQQIATLEAKISESNNLIQKTQSDFKTSYDHLKAQFEGDITKMQKYLK